jgi:hypothetical protein
MFSRLGAVANNAYSQLSNPAPPAYPSIPRSQAVVPYNPNQPADLLEQIRNQLKTDPNGTELLTLFNNVLTAIRMFNSTYGTNNTPDQNAHLALTVMSELERFGQEDPARLGKIGASAGQFGTMLQQMGTHLAAKPQVISSTFRRVVSRPFTSMPPPSGMMPPSSGGRRSRHRKARKGKRSRKSRK